MSFSSHARKVRNPHCSLGQRFSALRSCLLRLNVLTQEGYHAILHRYAAQLSFDAAPHLPSEEQVLAALTQVERERNQILEQLRQFERRRIRHKMQGKRQPSKHEKDVLQSAIAQVRRGQT
jgi:hypothetical protein